MSDSQSAFQQAGDYMHMNNTPLFTSSVSDWSHVEYATKHYELPNMWKDVPSDIGPLMAQLKTWGTCPETIAERIVSTNTSVEDFEKLVSWLIDNADHGFTSYWDKYGTKRWRMTKKAFVYKTHNWSAKGLASNIQDNRFWVNKHMFGGGTLTGDNTHVKAWKANVLGRLPKLRMEAMEKKDNQTIGNMESEHKRLAKANKHLDSFVLEVESKIQKAISRVFDDALDTLKAPIDSHMIGFAKADDHKDWMNTNMLGNLEDIVFTENKQKFSETAQVLKQEAVKFLSLYMQVETLKKQYTQEEEE